MLPFVTYGIDEASTTRRPSVPCTRRLLGSSTDAASAPMRQVQEGCSAVSASLATQARISSSVETPGPVRKNKQRKPVHGQLTLRSAGCIETGCLQAYWT